MLNRLDDTFTAPEQGLRASYLVRGALGALALVAFGAAALWLAMVPGCNDGNQHRTVTIGGVISVAGCTAPQH
jgi:hypothetical protein